MSPFKVAVDRGRMDFSPGMRHQFDGRPVAFHPVDVNIRIRGQDHAAVYVRDCRNFEHGARPVPVRADALLKVRDCLGGDRAKLRADLNAEGRAYWKGDAEDLWLEFRVVRRGGDDLRPEALLVFVWGRDSEPQTRLSETNYVTDAYQAWIQNLKRTRCDGPALGVDARRPCPF